MKRFFTFLFVVCPCCIFAQFTDNFSDGDFTQDPIWVGTSAKFVVNNLLQLQLRDTTPASSANKAYLSTVSHAIINAEWQCVLSINTNLTSSNYVRFYVVSDSSDLTTSLNGYFVLIGGTAKEVSLYRQSGTTMTKLIDGTDNRFPTSLPYELSVKVQRDSLGNWTLLSKVATDSTYLTEGSVVDKTFYNANYTGLFFYYSSSNSSKYACANVQATGSPYVPKQQKLQKNDLVFSEIMADPDPQVGLPNLEYLELYNRTNQTVDMANWKLFVGSDYGIITDGEIPPHSYVILTAESSVTEFVDFGTVIPVKKFQALTNAGKLIVLTTDLDSLVAWVDFTDKWYGLDAFKKEGGWSLERINLDYLDNHAENWMPSISSTGGTPGGLNSMAGNLVDTRSPVVEYVAALAADTLLVKFSKSMDERLLADLENYSSDFFAIKTIWINQPYATDVKLVLNEPLNLLDMDHLVCKNLKCVDGLALQEIEWPVALPQNPCIGDVVLNEILFNPLADGVDYVEIVNVSHKTLDLSQIFITKRKQGYLDVKTTITTDPVLFYPNDYIVLTSNPVQICSAYECGDSGRFFVVNLPSMNDDAGDVVLSLVNGEIIDEFAYAETMHHVFVRNRDGVALERVNPYTPTQNVDNWQSASFSAGYGTPGARNSQYSVPDLDAQTSLFWFENEVFTPDNDGFDDLLHLNYNLSQDGFSVSAHVYDRKGQHVRTLLNNELVGTTGTLTWNGLTDGGTMCRVGVYVLFVDAVLPQGTRHQKRLVCVLSAH